MVLKDDNWNTLEGFSAVVAMERVDASEICDTLQWRRRQQKDHHRSGLTSASTPTPCAPSVFRLCQDARSSFSGTADVPPLAVASVPRRARFWRARLPAHQELAATACGAACPGIHPDASPPESPCFFLLSVNCDRFGAI
jgi:hypothetical protein